MTIEGLSKNKFILENNLTGSEKTGNKMAYDKEYSFNDKDFEAAKEKQIKNIKDDANNNNNNNNDDIDKEKKENQKRTYILWTQVCISYPVA